MDGSVNGCAHGFPRGLGDVYRNVFTSCAERVKCGLDLCICDFHYYTGVIPGLDDSRQFDELLRGRMRNVSLDEYLAWIDRTGIRPVKDLRQSVGFSCGAEVPTAQPQLSIAKGAGEARSTVFSGPESEDIEIRSAAVQDLHKALGFAKALDYPQGSLNRPLDQWKMEVDDAPIFRYLYRNFRPRRHLEVGTWQGTGTAYCLEECDATVWTINLLEGERLPDGRGAYGTSQDTLEELKAWVRRIGLVPAHTVGSDSLGFIGWRYLSKNLGRRVCQIYCDSREWDTANYPPGFFDSALIDGGHQSDVVVSDTQKVLPLVRSGGLVMWHDFCPPVFDKFESTRGVMEAVRAMWDTLKEEMAQLFWIQPSWILLGVRK